MKHERHGVENISPCLFAGIRLSSTWNQVLNFRKHTSDLHSHSVLCCHRVLCPRLPELVTADCDNGNTHLASMFCYIPEQPPHTRSPFASRGIRIFNDQNVRLVSRQ